MIDLQIVANLAKICRGAELVVNLRYEPDILYGRFAFWPSKYC